MSARLFDTAEAVARGLVARSVPADAPGDAFEAEVARYLACPPGSVAEALIRALGGGVREAWMDLASAALADRWDSAE